jgi:hypothetical protein
LLVVFCIVVPLARYNTFHRLQLALRMTQHPPLALRVTQLPPRAEPYLHAFISTPSATSPRSLHRGYLSTATAHNQPHTIHPRKTCVHHTPSPTSTLTHFTQLTSHHTPQTSHPPSLPSPTQPYTLLLFIVQVRREVRTQAGSAGRLSALEDKLAVLEGAVVGAGGVRCLCLCCVCLAVVRLAGNVCCCTYSVSLKPCPSTHHVIRHLAGWWLTRSCC